MGDNPVRSCRGCYEKVEDGKSYSFIWPEIKELYTDCTGIQIPDDEKGLPQQLCLECYSKCEQWYSFQTMCNEVNDHLVKNLKDPPAETELLVEKTCTVSESEEYMEPLQLEEEEDEVQEEDSLAAYSFGELIRDVDSDNSDHKSKAAAAPEGDGSQCPVCATIMSRGQLLGDHLKAHYSEEDPKCPICNQRFKRGFNVLFHLLSVHVEKPLEENNHHQNSPSAEEQTKECPFCKVACESLVNHIYSTHIVKDKTCPFCTREFKQSGVLKAHLVTHTHERPFACKLCSMTYTQSGRLHSHVQKVHGAESVLSTAADTKRNNEKSFSESAGLLKKPRREETQKKDSGDTNCRYVCPVCNKGYKSVMELHAHFVKHTDERPFQCKYCEIDRRFKGDVTRHIREVHPTKSAADGVLIKEGSIFLHDHPWEKMGLQLPTQSSAAEAFKCKECPREYSFEKALRKHSLGHLERRPYYCKYCFKDGRSRSKLTEHIQRSHPNESTKGGVLKKKRE